MKTKGDNELFKKPVSDMTEDERRAAIERLEGMRDEIVYQIEEIMQRAAKATKKGGLKRRRYKLGKSPNDRSAK